MKSFNATWRASDWGEDEPDGVTVYRPGEESWDHLISHERQIEDAIPDAPEELKVHVQKEVMAHRELEEDEGINSQGELRKFAIEGDRVRVGEANCLSRSRVIELLASPGLEDRNRALWSRALAYLDKHAPKLAENEVQCDSGVVQLRWRDGKAEYKWVELGWATDEEWKPFHGGVAGDKKQAKMVAYFRAHCPIDRFVTDEGEVLEFRMTEQGGAEFDGTKFGGRTGPDETFDPFNWLMEHREVAKALYRFRDHERGTWAHEWREHGVDSFFEVMGPGNVVAYPNWQHNASWSPNALSVVPLWKRREVEALYREKDPEKVVFEGKWREIAPDNSRVTFEAYCGQLPAIPKGPLRVTIEPLGDG